MNDYIEMVCTIHDAQPYHAEVLMTQLADIGFDTFTENDNGSINAYVKADLFDFEAVKQLYINEECKIDYTYTTIVGQNWNEEWEKNFFQPIVVGDRCVVRSAFHTDYPKAEYELVITPNMAFGTGHHETTGLMLSFILNHNPKGLDVLDMGTGTGILAILCAKMGARKVLGIEIEEIASQNARDNALQNDTSNVEILHGDASLIGNNQYDWVLANIVRNVVIADLPQYAAAIRKGGRFFTSGFYEADVADITAAAQQHGLQYIKHERKNAWVAAEFIKL